MVVFYTAAAAAMLNRTSAAGECPRGSRAIDVDEIAPSYTTSRLHASIRRLQGFRFPQDLLLLLKFFGLGPSNQRVTNLESK